MTTKIRVTPTPLTIPIVAAGNVGQPGSQGPEGPPGPPGSPGPASTVPGPPGEQGIQGPPGTTGAIGPQGAQGPPGSAGATGPAGANGAQGPQGLPGAPGADSTVPGPAGAQGPQGPAGPAGADSTVPGPPGSTGPAGSTGAQGPKGDKGDTGTTGSTGPPGTAGATGAPGATGAAGAPGPNVVNGTTATPFTALLKGTGSLVAQAIPGTDYAIPTDLGLKVDKDSVVVAATRIVANKLLAGDAQPAFRISGNGKIEWGAGGAAATDVTLSRNTVNRLVVDGEFTVIGLTIVDGNGTGKKLWFGAEFDTNLYRAAANTLKTDGGFYTGFLVSAGDVYAGSGASQILLQGGKVLFGNPADTNLYRSAVAALRTDGTLQSGSIMQAAFGSANEVGIGWGGLPGAGLYFGSAADTTLFRSAAQTLQVSLALKVESWAMVGANNADTHLYFGGAFDTNLYRAGANQLQTDGYLYTGQAAYIMRGTGSQVGIVAKDGSQAALVFGSAGDTNLYRSGAGLLVTDGQFRAGSHVQTNAHLMAITDAGKLFFGAAADTSLYRLSANIVKTDGFMVAGLNVRAFDGQAAQTAIGNYGPASQSAVLFGADTTLYRPSANALQTDGILNVFGTGGSAGFTALGINGNGVGNRTVQVGAPDSGGSGKRALTVPN